MFDERVGHYIDALPQWQRELCRQLRELIHAADPQITETIKNGTESIGVHTKVKVVKNKLSPPFLEAEFDVIYGEGISREGSVLDAAVEQNLVEKSGTWHTYQTERIGQGRENAKKYLKDNPKLMADLEVKVRAALGLRPVGGAPTVAEPQKVAK